MGWLEPFSIVPLMCAVTVLLDSADLANSRVLVGAAVYVLISRDTRRYTVSVWHPERPLYRGAVPETGRHTF